MINDNTPFELRNNVWVKREDLSCGEGSPSFSKVRGVDKKIRSEIEKGTKAIGVLDTVHSKAGWGVAWLCNNLKIDCYNFYPVYKRETEIRPFQIQSLNFGAKMLPLPAGRSAILYHMAKKIFHNKTSDTGYIMPNGLKLPESVEATEIELTQYTPENLFGGTWVVSVSSGTIAKGVWNGLKGRAKLICHMGYSHSHDACQKYIQGSIEGDIELIDENFAYKDKIDYPCDFPCNPYYDLKAWRWLCENKNQLKQPIVFWNIGA